DVVGETQNELIHYLILADSSRDRLDACICRHVTNELFGVEPSHSCLAISAGRGGDIEDVRLGGHRGHRRIYVLVDKLMSDVGVENCAEVRRVAVWGHLNSVLQCGESRKKTGSPAATV